MKRKKRDGVRSMALQVYVPDSLFERKIFGSIKRYRAACRQLYATYALGVAGGAEIRDDGEGKVTLMPDKESTRTILTTLTGAPANFPAYPLRPYFFEQLFPSAQSFVWDSCRQDVESVWRSLDPEFTKAQRGYLALQGARGLALFMRRGIGCPVQSARPKLVGDTVTVKWDKDLGSVTFKLEPLDGGRQFVWNKLRAAAPGWKLGTIYVTERKRKGRSCLFLLVTYERPLEVAETDAGRVCRVEWTDEHEKWLRIVGPDGATTVFEVSAVAAVESMRELKVRQAKLELRKSACGAKHQPWGHKDEWNRVQAVVARCTLHRANATKDFNHAWTRRIVDAAAKWRCGQIQVEALPKTLFGHSWPWYAFLQCLKYKATFVGIATHLPKPPKTEAEEAEEALALEEAARLGQ